MEILVIRHGQTELNQRGIINGQIDDTLTTEGIEQARNAALVLPRTIKHIYSSSLARAVQTAEILNETLNVSLTFHDDLREVDFGILNGTPFLEEYKTRHRALDYDWRPSGESVEEVKTRLLRFLNTVKKEGRNEERLIVAHGGIIRLLHFLEFGERLDKIENTSLHTFDLDKILK